ncbi:hypothetical protein QQ045_021538 [Rhodiola kirilowii]
MLIGRPQPYYRDPSELEDDMHPFYRPCWSYLKWAGPKHFEETPRGSLIFYRDQIERMVHGDFIYRPYEEYLMERLHPLIRMVATDQKEKKVDWRVYLADDVRTWNSRWDRLIYGDSGEEGEYIDMLSDEYVKWYSMITRRLIQPKLEEDDTHGYRPSAHELPSNIHTLLICATQAAEGFISHADARPIFHHIFHTAVDELQVLGELRLLNINPDTIQFGNGEDDDMSVDDDHATNFESPTPCHDRLSSSEAPPSEPPPASMSYDTPSPPGHGHNIRPAKPPKQSWLQKFRNRRKPD